MKDIIEKKCENCRHYVQHYVKRGLKYAKLTYANCGCADRKGVKIPKEACGLWVRTKQKEEVEESITKVLRRTSKEIHDIALILKEITLYSNNENS